MPPRSLNAGELLSAAANSRTLINPPPVRETLQQRKIDEQRAIDAAHHDHDNNACVPWSLAAAPKRIV